MTTTLAAPAGALLTYEDYMAEPVVAGRYDIINGVRIFMPGASWEHQIIVGNLIELLRAYARISGVGKALSSPFDVLIRRAPKLQTRQPDVLMISHGRLTAGGGIPKEGPLLAAPELVIEIISDSETQRRLNDKLADYCAIGVNEAWVVRPNTRMVEVLRLTPRKAEIAAVYDDTQSVASAVFAALIVPVADILAQE